MLPRTLALALLLASTTTLLADRQVTITDQEHAAWGSVPALMDQCIGALVVRRDAGPCQDLAPFLFEFSKKVKDSPAIAPSAPKK